MLAEDRDAARPPTARKSACFCVELCVTGAAVTQDGSRPSAIRINADISPVTGLTTPRTATS